MRSHMMKFYAAEKQKKVQTFEKDSQPSDDFQLSSSTSVEEEEHGEKEVLCYGLRENPKKSIRFVDPRFFFASSSVVLQDRESEIESIPNPIFTRSKRIRKTRISVKETEMMKKSKFEKGENTSNEFSDQPLSSISDTPEEDVAYCLMMLSRDTWQREQYEYEEEEEENRERNKYEDDDYSEDSGAVKVAKSTKVGGKYRCETCNKVFRSYQALGGHRANHKKIKVNIKAETSPRMVVETGKNGGSIQVVEKIHECPICFRVFSSGQALGGHKRSHFTGGGAISTNVISINTTTPPPAKPFSRLGETLNIDLNLPAPVEDDDEISQIVNFA